MRKAWLLMIGMALICTVGRALESSNAPAALYVDTPLKVKGTKRWDLPRFAIDPSKDHIYGISFEGRGDAGSMAFIDFVRTLQSNGTGGKTVGFDTLKNYGVRTGLGREWRPGRAEFFTKRGAAWLIPTMSIEGAGEVEIRNIRVVDGGFPDNPPIKGPPYLDWIESLRPNTAYADTNAPDRFRWIYCEWINLLGESPDNFDKEIQPYLRMSVTNLIQVVPARRPMSTCFNADKPSYHWDPRRPDVLTDKTGQVFDVVSKYPITGYEEVLAPSGKTVKYPYYDSPGTVVPPTLSKLADGDVAFPGEWMAFGPVTTSDPVPATEILQSLPAELEIAGHKLKGQKIILKDNQIDFGSVFGGKDVGKTVYAFAPIIAETNTTITMGAGCDWWMQWWVNGKCVCDTLVAGNGNWPPSWTDHVFNVDFKQGTNILAVRAISGSGSFKFAAGGPRELRGMIAQGWSFPIPPPPKGRIYLDRFMTSARVWELCHAADVMTYLYRKNKDKEYALRSAAILWAISKAIPDWPIYGNCDWENNEPRFLPPDTHDCWFAFIIGDWYTPSMGSFSRLTRLYDALRPAPVWDELAAMTGQSNPRADIENGLLHAAKMSLKHDAYFRNVSWKFFNNTCGTQIRVYIEIGRAVGCPELVHYALQKAEMIMKYRFMVDGMFPESVSYLNDIGGQLDDVFRSLEGYKDPPGFVAQVDGRHIESFDLEKDIPLYKRVQSVRDRLHFPDWSMLTMHDTVADSQGPTDEAWKIKLSRSPVQPYLLPEFGHAILGQGARPDWLETHLHYSASCGHHHQDILNFTLWAYGDELTADVGYSHLGGYQVTTLSHNLVVVDEKIQDDRVHDYGNRADLTAYFPNRDAAQAVQASCANAYKQTDCYRRAIINIPFRTGEVAVVDIFEVSGGSRHEWMANGCADYGQKVTSDLGQPIKTLANLADDGKPLTVNVANLPDYGLPSDLKTSDKKSNYYGAFFNARIFRPSQPWQVTMTAEAPVPAGTPGAGPRAVTKWASCCAAEHEPKPGLRLHWVAPLDGEAILCEAPRQRYLGEFWHGEEAGKAWHKNLMPKVIVRRDADNSTNGLVSTFVAVWEPFKNKPWLEGVNRISAISTNDGLGVRLSDGTNTAIVLYRKPESQVVLSATISPSQKTGKIKALVARWFGAGSAGNKLTSNARFTVLRCIGEETMLDVYDGSEGEFGDVKVKVWKYPDMQVSAVVESNNEYAVMVADQLSGYPSDKAQQPHAGQYVIFRQSGQPISRWLPLLRVGESEVFAEPCEAKDAILAKKGENGQRRLVLEREPGFEFNSVQNYLHETFFPFRTFQGPQGGVTASVSFPAWVNLKWHKTSEGGIQAALKASGKVTIGIKGLKGNVKCKMRLTEANDWVDLPLGFDKQGNAVADITPYGGAKWCELKFE